jgi:hypothetical protein
VALNPEEERRFRVLNEDLVQVDPPVHVAVRRRRKSRTNPIKDEWEVATRWRKRGRLYRRSDQGRRVRG